jgi:hypothetical protein
MQSVLQDWVQELPLRFQGTLLTAVRGCDDEPKFWRSIGVAFSQGRRITAYIRWCFMNPADPREVDAEEGAFKPSQFGHLPQHWYAHVMHALEIIAYEHPVLSVKDQAWKLYYEMVHSFHLNTESREQLWDRLTEDRVAKGQIVS